MLGVEFMQRLFFAKIVRKQPLSCVLLDVVCCDSLQLLYSTEATCDAAAGYSLRLS